MKKNILTGVLLLSVCTSQGMVQKTEARKTEVQSLLEKYVPGARTAKKAVFFGALFWLFGGAQSFALKAPTLQECAEKMSKLRSIKKFGPCGSYREGIGFIAWSGCDDNRKMGVSIQRFNTWQSEVECLAKRCTKQLKPKDRVVFFKQLNHELQRKIFEELDYKQATELEKALKK